MARLLSGVSMLLLPLVARDALLGFFVCIREVGYRRFDAYDTEIGMEFASRAAIFMDSARRYSRERATALTLQRSMLPTGLSAPSSVEVKHRYLPGSKLIEVGGDWYESIALPGGRVALVVGDVAGHGVRAAVTMGRLRTAIHTLAMLELPPAETLQQLDELMQELGAREPHFATCVYAIFDAVTGSCELASAGHLPPLLVRPDGTNELLDVLPVPAAGHRHRADPEPGDAALTTAACWCSTLTGWSRSARPTSTRGWTGCAGSSVPAQPTGRSRSCARPPWTGCTPTTSETTSRC